MKIFKATAQSLALVLFLAGTSVAEPGRDYCEVHGKADPELCSYEPTTIGYTHDSDDNGFMDFTISVRYQLFPTLITRGQNYLHNGLGYDKIGRASCRERV